MKLLKKRYMVDKGAMKNRNELYFVDVLMRKCVEEPCSKWKFGVEHDMSPWSK